ncbi:MAG UNVERIFIED_CONTAM: hypothetical protein LVT10_25690 [Anaerolineae bacterium]|jgi:NADH-quinone oxidoreductase subunit M
MFGLSIVTLTLFLPLVGMTVLLFMKEEQQNEIKWTAFGVSVATFLASLLMWIGFDNTNPDLQMVQQWAWLPQFGINYYVWVDGLSLLLVILTTFIMPIAIMSSFHAHVIEERGRAKLYYIFMLLLEWAMIGVFVVHDLFVFYVFWEITLVPMYFLIGIWGGEERRYASIKFFLYTMAGSILMLIAILYLGINAGTFTVEGAGGILEQLANGSLTLPMGGFFSLQNLLFLGFFIAFAIKVPGGGPSTVGCQMLTCKRQPLAR